MEKPRVFTYSSGETFFFLYVCLCASCMCVCLLRSIVTSLKITAQSLNFWYKYRRSLLFGIVTCLPLDRKYATYVLSLSAFESVQLESVSTQVLLSCLSCAVNLGQLVALSMQKWVLKTDMFCLTSFHIPEFKVTCVLSGSPFSP